jgi:hypothetical protein
MRRSKDPIINQRKQPKMVRKALNFAITTIETILAQTAETGPSAKGHKVEEYMGLTFFNELESSGFFRSLSR